MKVRLTKLSDAEHAVHVTREDGTTDRATLASRSFLRHDLAHWAVEIELGLQHGVWGSVAAGGSLDGDGLDGEDVTISESIAGPVQTLMRIEASATEIQHVLSLVAPQFCEPGMADRLHERLRQLRGHWKATPYGDDMVLTWPSRR